MQKTELQNAKSQSQSVVRREGGIAIKSPRSKQMIQFKTMIESSPQMEKPGSLAMMNASPAMTVQRKLKGIIDNSPHMAVQRKMAAMVNSSPCQRVVQKFADNANVSPMIVAQRKKFEGLFGAVQRVEDEGSLQGKFASEATSQRGRQTAVKLNNTGLPDNLKSGIENLSGLSMDSVKVHYNSFKPAQLNALAYAQGADIYVAPRQEQHVPHEAWHIVQQAQGRVLPTMQMKGGVSVNDDQGLEAEADVMGRRAAAVGADSFEAQQAEQDPVSNRPTSTNAQKLAMLPVQYTQTPQVKYAALNCVMNPEYFKSVVLQTDKRGQAGEKIVQMVRKKRAKKTAGGALIGGVAGAVAGSIVPGVGSVVGGMIGAAVGALLGYFGSRPTLYKNSHAGNYTDELSKFNQYQRGQARTVTDYERGTIISYSASTSDRFNSLLHAGNVLYTYDENSKLNIGSNVGGIKHPLVAKNKKVKAAGHANVRLSKAMVNQGNFIDVTEKLLKYQTAHDNIKSQNKELIARFEEDKPFFSLEEQGDVKKHKEKIISNYDEALFGINYFSKRLKKLESSKREAIVASKNNEIELDNESGHYHPSASSKNEAIEAWRNAGYRKLRWRAFGR